MRAEPKPIQAEQIIASMNVWLFIRLRLATWLWPDDDGAMRSGPTEILDTHAEAFSARYARLIVTAVDLHWVNAAVIATTGYATSVIGCDCEAGVDRILSPSETPDGRPGASLLFFAFTTKKLAGGVANRVGQCVLTCPTTACFNALPNARRDDPARGLDSILWGWV